MRRIMGLAALVLALGCARGEHAGVAGTTFPVDAELARKLAAQDRDCLQYPVGHDANGSEIWNADWVFFSLIRDSDSLLAKHDDGTPIAVNLLHSEVEEFMAHQQPIPGTSWTYVLQRAQQRTSGGRVMDLSPYELVVDFDLDDILRRDRDARGHEPGTIPAPR